MKSNLFECPKKNDPLITLLVVPSNFICPGDLIRRPDRLRSDRNPIRFYANFRQTDEFL